ncbi:hypothetical protein UlMin_040570 [Ulmus minor]
MKRQRKEEKAQRLEESKKSKRGGLEKGKEEVVEERRVEGGLSWAAVAAESVGIGWDVQENWWPWLGGLVDEQMSWGSIWLPFWDVEFMGEAYHSLFSDVMWDDDIWGIRGIKEVSNTGF